MKEYVTDALVLDTEDIGELDKIIYFYTSSLGKISARAKSIRKITSKLAGQLEPLSFVKIRLVEKNGVQVTDAILLRPIAMSSTAVALAQFIKVMTFEFQPDKKLWLLIKKSFEDIKSLTVKDSEKDFFHKPFLEVLGFAPEFASCHLCEDKKVSRFSPAEQLFFCNRCASKIPKNELVLI